MANEHVLILETHIAEPMTVADGTSIEKGTFLKMTDPNTAAASDGDADIVAGVLKVEKVANSGITRAAVYRGGKFRATASGSITVGDALITASSSGGANQLATAGVNAENLVGTSLETATNGETFMYELNPRSINVA